MSHPPKISRDAIVEAALAIIDEGGLGDLSVGAIGNRLGVSGPSLYHHFEGKSEILSQVARSIILETPTAPLAPGQRWQDWLIEESLGMRRTILRHPNAAGLVFEYFPRESIAAAYKRSSKYLEEANVPTDRHLLIFEGLDKLTLGSAFYASLQSVRDPAGSKRATPIPGRQKEMSSRGWNEEDLFIELLRSFLDGVFPGNGAPRKAGSK